MCRDLMLCRKPSVLKTSINIITTTATPTFHSPRSRTSEGEDRGKGDEWSPRRLRVIGLNRSRGRELVARAGPKCGLLQRRYKGSVGMDRWVGLGVIADNLIV